MAGNLLKDETRIISMRVKSISLRKGYKRFLDTTLDLGEQPKKIVALVGKNGSGKSSVFDGMLYIQNYFAKIGEYSNKESDFHSMDQDPAFNNSWQENVQIEFDNGSFQDVFNKKNAAGFPKTMFVFRGPHRYCSSLNVTALTKISDIKENSKGASSTVDLDDKITHNYQRLYSLIDRKVREAGDKGYSVIRSEVIGTLNIKLRNILGIEIEYHGDIIDGKGTLFFKKPDQVKSFEFNVLSSGEKEVVDIILDIFLRSETYKETIYIIDEPELHLNTGIQRRLLNEIVGMIPESSQLWIATHSIGFLNALKQDHVENADVFWFEGRFGSEKICLKPIKKNRENWKKIFQTALEDLTGLLSPKEIVYCEGRKEPNKNGEEQGLDAEAYNLIFSVEHPDTLFISSGGQTEPERYSEVALSVLGKAFEGVEILVLKDKDINSDGSPTSDEQRSSWLAGAQNRRMLERKEIENYLLDYEIVKAAYPDLTALDYEKVVPDINAHNVKDNVSKIMTLCIGGGNISKHNFLLGLAAKITPETRIYSELQNIIFDSAP